MKTLQLHKDLKTTVLFELPFGSHIYNTAIPGISDLDLIRLIPEDTGQFILQYKDTSNRIDISYVGINQFVNGLAACSNGEFFEALHTEEGQDFLRRNELSLIKYYNDRMVKAFLGYAKRDLDYENKLYYSVKSLIIAMDIQSKNILDVNTLNKRVNFQLKTFSKEELKHIISEMRKGLKYEDLSN